MWKLFMNKKALATIIRIESKNNMIIIRIIIKINIKKMDKQVVEIRIEEEISK